jgi:recombination protein RecT
MSTKEIKAVMNKAKKAGTLAGLKHTDITTVIEGMRPQLEMALPKHLNADRLIQMAANLITKNPKLGECSAASLMGAVMEASILGFKPANALGQCYFVPYGGHVQFQVGYKGYVDLARRSGQIKTLYAYVVRKGDEFVYELGLEPKLTHKPTGASDQEVTHVYAVAHYKDGGYNFVVLTRDEVEKLRLRNPMQKGAPRGAWQTDYEAMAKAKAIKQLAKYMPLSDEMQSAVLSDEARITPDAFTNNHTGIDFDNLEYPTEEAESEDVTDEPQNGKDDNA